MPIDFKMTGINLFLLAGLIIALMSVCLLIIQRPIKNRNRFSAKDYTVLIFILMLFVVGAALTLIGLVQTFKMIS